MNCIDLYLNIFGNIFTIVASGIAIYIFVTNRKNIKSAFSVLLNYSYHLTLTELKFKIERLQDLRIVNEINKDEVINILHEIEGQISGNKILSIKLHEELLLIRKTYSNTKSLTEAKKRLVVTRLKESIKDLDVSNMKITNA